MCITDEDMSATKYGSRLQGKVCGILPDERNILIIWMNVDQVKTLALMTSTASY